MRRFIPFVNTMTSDTTTKHVEPPVPEKKINVAKIEYRLEDRMEKTIECRVIQSKFPVTKGFT